MIQIDKPKPKTYYYHYSNPDSQGSLLTETPGFPNTVDDATYGVFSAYTDRIMSWDGERYERAQNILESGLSNPSAYRNCSNEKLKRFAKEALDLPTDPVHVRVVYYFNVSNGCSCPLIIAVYPKEHKETDKVAK